MKHSLEAGYGDLGFVLTPLGWEGKSKMRLRLEDRVSASRADTVLQAVIVVCMTAAMVAALV